MFQSTTTAISEEMQFIIEQVPKLNERTRLLINEQITAAEIERTIKYLSRNKAPGPGGIGSVLYKTFCLGLSSILCRVFNYIYARMVQQGHMPQTLVHTLYLESEIPNQPFQAGATSAPDCPNPQSGSRPTVIGKERSLYR